MQQRKPYPGQLIQAIQDCNLNFLIGSGMSADYLSVLGDIENWLTKINKDTSLTEDTKIIAKASVYKLYFNSVISKNQEILEGRSEAKEKLKSYSGFIDIINTILFKRKTTILSKQANLFTTNIDIFLDRGLEVAQVEYNDGFYGKFQPIFSQSNFKKSYFKSSLHFENKSELPVFNLIKIHGSVSWETAQKSDDITLSLELRNVKKVKKSLSKIDGLVVDLNGEESYEELITSSEEEQPPNQDVKDFISAFNALPIVNPNKEKFRHSLLNQNYYELLRIYANELERENSLLLVMGFSFADEHIRDVTLRAANSNPTLIIYIFARSKSSIQKYQDLLISKARYDNIKIISPPQKTEDDEEVDEYQFTLEKLNSAVFGGIKTEIKSNENANGQPNK